MRKTKRHQGVHLYVDESTAADYLVICAVVPVRDISTTRKAMKGLLLPGQRSLHMKHDRGRSTPILSTIVKLAPQVLIFRVSGDIEAMEARRRAVQEIAREACRLGAVRVVFDTIESVIERDRSWVLSGARSQGHHVPPFSYHHQFRHEEPLLWIADAVGWAWARGGSYRTQVAPIVTLSDL